MSTPNIQELEGYLIIGRTLCEIRKNFLLPTINDAADIIKSIKVNPEFDVFPTINSEGKRIFLARRKPLIVPPTPRVWSHIIAADRKGKPQPYIIIKMPDDVPWGKIKIYLLGDMHYGSKSFDADAFNAFLELIKSKDYAFLIGIGDLMENALGDSVGGAIYDQGLNPTEQIFGVRELIRPVAHKVLCIVPGNHEWRSWKASNLDPLQFGVCEHLGIPYFTEPIHIDILWHEKIFPFYAKHGSTNSQTKGGKLNAAARPLSFNQFVMFTVSGHTHDPMSDKNIKRCREYIRDKDGNIVGMKIVKHIEYTVVCPAFYEPWGNYGSRADFNPVSDGFVQACVIEPDGRYHVDKKPINIPGREDE